MHQLPFRQVHLDFHTSPHIPDIAADFDPQAFVATLKAAHVNSITVFAKCHHGYSYYPTEIGTPHPHLRRPDLLGEMIAACHAAGIRAPVYTTVTWDELAWQTHPEWRQIAAATGGTAGPSSSPLRPGWKNLCMNTGYGDYVIAQIEELLGRYAVDGLFIDIVRYIGGPCICSTCLAQMRKQGVNPEDAEQLARFSLEAERGFMRRCTAAIRAITPDTGIFYNSRLRVEGDPELGNRAELDDFTHIEIESLPGGFWGYDHFPLYVRYFETFDRQLMAMMGRFHTTWGDFGGLRNRAALEFECFQGLAHGAVCSIGDQLHPRGRLDPAVYARIGEVYAEVERREPFVVGSISLPDIGVITAKGGLRESLTEAADIGALHALEQLKHQFHVLDIGSDLAPYKVVVLPDAVRVDAGLARRLRDYVAGGGRLLVTGASGLDEAAGDFAIGDLLGVRYRGRAPFAPDYLALGPELAAGLEPFDTICEQQGLLVEVLPGAEVLARSRHPYFNRTWEHFCSHQYTPQAEVSDEPVAVRRGGVIYIARPLFSEYAETSRRAHREVIGNALRLLLPEPRVADHTLPTTAIATVRRQEGDLVLHLLHYVHQRRGRGLDIIEDVLPLHDVALSVRAEHEPSDVRLAPEDTPVTWEWRDG
ncbi:MAG: hypothetical protein RLZZ387_488, partial [Chloroflexota bacterium]